MAALNLCPSRIRFVSADGTLTPEAYRALQAIVERTGGVLGDVGVDTSMTVSMGGNDLQQSIGGDVYATQEVQDTGEMVMQPTSPLQAIAVNAASTDLASVIALCNQLRAALISNNITI